MSATPRAGETAPVDAPLPSRGRGVATPTAYAVRVTVAAVDVENVVVPVVAVAAAVVLALVVVVAIAAVARRVGRHSQFVADLSRRCHRAVAAILVIVFGWVALLASTSAAQWRRGVSQALAIALIAAVAWLGVGLARVLEDAAVRRATAGDGDERQYRRVRTQAQMLRRIVVAAVVVGAVGAALLTFPEVRAIGAGVFASAGLLSIVAGLAAQSSLGNVFAGIQLAFSDAIRIDDQVVVSPDGPGRVEEITLTYVVVRLWDDRRVILPSTHLTTTPYENWSHKADELFGTVELDVDWSLPIPAARAELDRILTASQYWDGRAARLDVTDATGGALRLRALVSARDSGGLWSLRCEVREGLAAWVVREQPGGLPRTRTQPLDWPGGRENPVPETYAGD